MDKSRLLDRIGAEGEDRLLLAKVLDRAEQAQSRNIPANTDFLSPQQQVLALDLLRLAGIPESGYVRLGGYDGAERNIILFLPDWLDAEAAETQNPIRVLRASFREEDKLSHRDFLGSLMGMGIVREKLGDILVSPGSADLMVLPAMWIKPAYKNAKGPAVYASLKGAAHTRCCLDPWAYAEYALEWFDLWLKDDATARNTFRSGGILSKDRDWKDFASKGI